MSITFVLESFNKFFFKTYTTVFLKLSRDAKFFSFRFGISIPKLIKEVTFFYIAAILLACTICAHAFYAGVRLNHFLNARIYKQMWFR
jgi:hypothetical protein